MTKMWCAKKYHHWASDQQPPSPTDFNELNNVFIDTAVMYNVDVGAIKLSFSLNQVKNQLS